MRRWCLGVIVWGLKVRVGGLGLGYAVQGLTKLGVLGVECEFLNLVWGQGFRV
jgi:hypothetical protein